MNNIRRFWNQNRKGIITGIIAIALLILFIQILNSMAKENNKNKVVTTLTEEEKLLPTKSIIGDKKVSVEKTEDNVQIIEEFIEKCNNQDIERAYNMLTDDCKEMVFKTQENFVSGYYNKIFKTKRIANIEQFTNSGKLYTYKVSYCNDVLSTGNIDDISATQDYITIDESSENGKLNISGLIYKKNINKEKEVEGIKIIVESKLVFKDFEKYIIKVENYTDKRILLDTKTQTKSVYLVGSNNVTYSSNIGETGSNILEVPSNFYRTYDILFRKIYSAGVGSDIIVFSDIIKDVETYKQNPSEYKERTKISVNI